MPLEALKTAAFGLLESERRAADAARRIVENTSRGASGADAAASGSEVPNRAALSSGSDAQGSVIQDIVDLTSESLAFQANAAAFKRIDETADELGRLIDRES